MHRTSFGMTLIACAWLATACGDDGSSPTTTDAPPSSPTFAPGEAPYGRTMSQWAAAWWTWALGLPRTGHPIAGGPCAAGQSGDVFFLAGNSGGVESRDCSIPPGTAIMFPILNSLCWPRPETEGCATPHSPEELTACAGDIFDRGPARSMTVTLDGAVLPAPESYRASTGVFSWPPPTFPAAEWLAPGLDAITANACGIPVGDRFGVGDGYWMVLRPLTPGPHVLRIAGTITGAISIDVTYQLTQR